MKSLQWEQKVGCLKNLGMKQWSLTLKTFFFFRAPFRKRDFILFSPAASSAVGSPLLSFESDIFIICKPHTKLWREQFCNPKSPTYFEIFACRFNSILFRNLYIFSNATFLEIISTLAQTLMIIYNSNLSSKVFVSFYKKDPFNTAFTWWVGIMS